MAARELLGIAAGLFLAPLTAAGSFVRRARLFHPVGLVYRAEVTAVVDGGPARELAQRLAGPALVRLSSAWWKNQREWPDILGVSVRFRSDPAVSPEAAAGDQDLLFATVRSTWTLAIAPFTTNTHNFLSNDYFALGVFDVPEMGRVKWRLTAKKSVLNGHLRRADSLEQAVRHGLAVLELQARPLVLGSRYETIAEIRLIERVAIDQAALCFSPFRSGRGIVAKGFINALRYLTYPISQAARPRRERPARP